MCLPTCMEIDKIKGKAFEVRQLKTKTMSLIIQETWNLMTPNEC